jgi:hypothetical protein
MRTNCRSGTLSPYQLGACIACRDKICCAQRERDEINQPADDWSGWLRSEIGVLRMRVIAMRVRGCCECRPAPSARFVFQAGRWRLAYAYYIPERTSISHHPMNFLLQQNCCWWSQNRRWWHTLLYSRTSHRIG